MDVIVGTAGHIDHGKTALVKALTGTDTDRLPEEKTRGITIDLGFAEMEASGVHFGFVDVPGHERFVKNMLAGASGIDLVVLVVAADEGVMPQTREHFEICRLLDVRAGVVVMTKRDLVDDEMLDLVRLEVAELVEASFLENAPVVPVDSKSGNGIDELKRELISVVDENHPVSATPRRRSVDPPPQTKRGALDGRIPILPIDRVFTMKGFGTIVTGTLVSGGIAENHELDLLPVGRRVRVRGLQTHGKSVGSAHAGQRTAVNLAGIDTAEIARGMLLAEKGVLRSTLSIDANVEVLSNAKRPIRSRQRVRVHLGSAEVLARVTVLEKSGQIEPGENGFVQLRFESPVVAYFGERFVIRSYSPQVTIAGGQLLDPFAERHRLSDLEITRSFLNSLSPAAAADVARLLVIHQGMRGITIPALRAATAWNSAYAKNAVDECIQNGSLMRADDILIDRSEFESASDRAAAEIEMFHKQNPLQRGITREVLRDAAFAGMNESVFNASLLSLERDGRILIEKEIVRSVEKHSEMSETDSRIMRKLEDIFRNAALEPPKLDEAVTAALDGTQADSQHARQILQVLVDSGKIAKVSDDFYFERKQIDDLIGKLKEFADSSSDRLIDVAKFKEIAGVSRKYAIPLLEYFDRERVTVRSGDKRLVLK